MLGLKRRDGAYAMLDCVHSPLSRLSSSQPRVADSCTAAPVEPACYRIQRRGVI